MKNVTKQQVFSVVLLIGVVVCLLIYMLVFTKYNDATAALKTSNAALKTEVDSMKEYYDNMEVYRTKVKEMVADIEERTEDYPGDAKEEDVIMMARDMSAVALMNFDKINVESPKVLLNIPEETVKGANIEGLDQSIDFVERKATYSNQTTYGNLKSAVEKVYDSPYRIGISSIAYRKESETNNFVQGTIDVCFYSINGMGKEYTAPEMPVYFGGATDLFGALPYSSDGEAADTAVAEGGEAAE